MKKFIQSTLVIALFAMFSATSVSAQGNVTNGQIIGAVKSTCGNNYTGPNVQYVATNIGQGRCINGNTALIYTVQAVFSCPPQHLTLCLPAPPVTVATVTVNCDGNIEVTCN